MIRHRPLDHPWLPRGALALLGAVAILYGATSLDGSHDATRPATSRIAVSPSTLSVPLVDIGSTPPDRDISFELVLAIPGREALLAYALSVSDPSSAHYHHFLTADQIGARFGLIDSDLARVTAWATAHGISVLATLPQRIATTVRASAGVIESLFGVTLHDYADTAGRIFQAPTGAARVPAELTGLVSAIAGLNARPSRHPSISTVLAAGPSGGMTPPIIDRVYELEGLRAQKLNGEGQTVAIVSLAGFDPADVTQFDGLVGIVSPPVERVPVDGGPRAQDTARDQIEVDLDIDVIRAVAPKAQILDYEGPNKGNSTIAVAIDQIVKDGRTDIVTISWGDCELNRATEMAHMTISLAAAAAAGISVFVASGDQGAYDCRPDDPTDQRLSVDSPAGDINAIAVGGTYVSMLENGTYVDEVAWEDPLTGWATGGGLSIYNQQTWWQVGPGVINARSDGMRQLPDVAAAADSDSGFLIVSAGNRGAEGGTSAASPFWAGFAVLVRQLAQREGVHGIGVLGLGPLGPTLYAVSAAQPPGSVFHDVIRGGNLHDLAGAGWDYATGLGTPRGTALARAIVDRLKAAP